MHVLHVDNLPPPLLVKHTFQYFDQVGRVKDAK